jgi:hypothetical protein
MFVSFFGSTVSTSTLGATHLARYINTVIEISYGHAVTWLRQYATFRKVAGSILNKVIGFFFYN